MATKELTDVWVCFTCFDFSAPIALLSLVCAETSPWRLSIVLIVGEVEGSEASFQRCKAICDDRRIKCRRIDFAKISVFFAERHWPTWGGTHLAYARLFLPNLLPNVSRIIYLDTDVLVMKPISELWEQDLHGKAFGAVHSPSYTRKSVNEDKPLTSNLGTANSGVMLMDLDRLRAIKSQEILRKVDSEKIWYADQHVLSLYFAADITYLPPKFNSMVYFHRAPYKDFCKNFLPLRRPTKREYYDAQRKPVIVHFNGSKLDRPWYKVSRSRHYSLWQRYAKSVYGHKILIPFDIPNSFFVKIYQRVMHHLRYLPNPLYFKIARRL